MPRTRLTSVGKIFAGLMLLFYIASVTSQSGLLLLFIGLMGGCFVVNGSFARRNVRNLHVIAPRLVEIVEGEAPRDPWRIENHSSKHAECMELFHHAGRLFQLPLVKSKDAVTVVPKFVYQRRGVYPNAEITVTCAAPYGLLRSTRKLNLEGEIVVLPRVYEAGVPVGNGLDQISGGRFRGGRRVSHGTHFAGVRPWQPGDTLKQVHWKSTARRDELMVKTFEEELGGRLSILLDCAGGEPVLVDNAVRAAGSVAVAALQQGHHLELHDGGGELVRLAPFSDEGDLLVRLARYQPGDRPSAELEQFGRSSALAIFGNAWQETWRELVCAARARNRRVSIYLPEGRRLPPGIDAELAWFGHAEILQAEVAPA